MKFRKDIQGFRALAFLLVFVFHINSSWLPGGFIGVDLFFVISGFLITSIMIHQKENGTFNFIDFFEKRIRRIIPAHFFMLLIVSLSGYFIYLYSDISGLKSSLLSSALFISNKYFGSGDSYFGAKLAENPLLHTWSLSIEMQFYFILPFLLIFISKKILPYVIGLLLFGITFYTSYNLINYGASSHIYFSLIARMPEFFIGVLLSLLATKVNFNEKVSQLISTFGLFLLLGSLIFINEHSAFPGVLALIPALGIGMLLISNENPISRFFSNKNFVYVGELSYSLYLWHWPIIAFMRYRNGWAKPQEFSIAEILIIVLLTILLSIFSYYFVEDKFRKLKSKKFVIAFLPLMLLLFSSILIISHVKLKDKIPFRYSRSDFGQKSHNTGIIEILGQSTARKPNVFLFGDSHSLVLKHFLHKIGIKNGFAIKTHTTSAFPALKGIDVSEIPIEMLNNYNRMQEHIIVTYTNIEKADIIILNSLDLTRLKSMKLAIEKIAQNLKDGQKLILINTYPTLERDPVRVNAGIIKKENDKFKLVNRSENTRFIDSLDQQYKNVYKYNLSKSDIFKDAPYSKDTVMYYDDNHLNIYGTTLLYNDLEKDFSIFLNHVMSD